MIVAIDGASTNLSVAIAERDGSPVATDGWRSAQRQSAELAPHLVALLAANDRAVRDISALAVGTGPGSFTGLRVAMSLAKGLAVALHRPIIGVPSLVAWLFAEPEAVAAIARAGAREAYLVERGTEAVRLVEVGSLEPLRDALVVAPGELAEAFDLRRAVAPAAAAAMATLAAVRLREAPAGDDPGTLEPIYLRAPRGVEAASEGSIRWL
jgi:tRNA threonylcarbamoyl adenosine modification protein YeaZ